MALRISQVKFHFLYPFALKERQRLKRTLVDLMEAEGKRPAALTYVFCSDDYLLDINKSYLQHDDLTDIITFDLSETEEIKIGEIYISVERVRENAASFGTSFREEILRVVFHGALHLCGYKDKTPAEISNMRAKEQQYIAAFSHDS